MVRREKNVCVCVRACVRACVHACVRVCVCARVRACVRECTLTADSIDHTISEKTQFTTNNNVRLKSCHTHLSSLLQPICYCAQIIEACCVTYMTMVIDAMISNNGD